MKKRLCLALLGGLVAGTQLTACVPLVAGAAVGGAALVASDRRTSGAYVDDQGIEVKLLSQLSSRYPAAHININSYNRAVLITGEVPDEASRSQVELTVRAIPNVRKVYNYTTLEPASPLSQRNNDTWITTKVRARLIDGKNIPSQTVKVVTERGVTYLLGLVTEAEGQAVVDIVRSTSGVQKVVPLFETLQSVPSAAS
ncbi:hypothetical protein GCM10011289_18100 [Paludibacterium paludis]|uniref:BON domain-containing protein n=2 Tax=Paludibacterium paludis TaxID=1225769 RepID=A0A918P272_9NEIS|nr:hypothetical protein GCM10011289_18100 [Paludibacterium paludis]